MMTYASEMFAWYAGAPDAALRSFETASSFFMGPACASEH
jgi:hypothetical protein